MYINNVVKLVSKSRISGSIVKSFARLGWSSPIQNNIRAQVHTTTTKLSSKNEEKYSYELYSDSDVEAERISIRPRAFIPNSYDVEECVAQYYNKKQKMSTTAWDDVLSFLIDNRPQLLNTLYRRLIQYAPDDVDEHAFIAKRYKLNYYSLSEGAKKAYGMNRRRIKPKKFSQFYQLPEELKANCKFIANSGEFEAMMDHLERQELLAFDTEDVIFTRNPKQLALIQIATTTKIFIVDCYGRKKIRNPLWKVLVERVFQNRDIIKLVFDYKGDIDGLRATTPSLEMNLDNFIDIQLLHAYLLQKKVMFYDPDQGQKYYYHRISLNNLTEECFNISLDKSQTLSLWLNRPLREEQFNYAAIDAYILIPIYLHIKAFLGDMMHEVHMQDFLRTQNLSVHKDPSKGIPFRCRSIC